MTEVHAQSVSSPRRSALKQTVQTDAELQSSPKKAKVMPRKKQRVTEPSSPSTPVDEGTGGDPPAARAVAVQVCGDELFHGDAVVQVESDFEGADMLREHKEDMENDFYNTEQMENDDELWHPMIGLEPQLSEDELAYIDMVAKKLEVERLTKMGVLIELRVDEAESHPALSLNEIRGDLESETSRWCQLVLPESASSGSRIQLG